METTKRIGIDRRIENDRRKAYDLNYFADGGVERRSSRERRSARERRVGWVQVDDWKSIYLGNLVCSDDFKYRQSTDPDTRAPSARTRTTMDAREDRRFWFQDYAYVVLKPSSTKMCQVVDISRRGLSFRYRDTGQEETESTEMDIFLAGEDFYLDKVPFETISEYDIDIELSDQALTMKQCSVEFGELTREQMERLDILIEKYTMVKM